MNIIAYTLKKVTSKCDWTLENSFLARERLIIGTGYQRKQYLHRAWVLLRRNWTIGWNDIGNKSHRRQSCVVGGHDLPDFGRGVVAGL